MPPNEGLSDSERAELIAWYSQALGSDCRFADAGRVTLRRLNRYQYQNTINDLLGVKVDLSEELPNDDVGEGFDNIGDVLSVSPLLLEKYLHVAETVTSEAIKSAAPYQMDFDLAIMVLTQGVSLTEDSELGFFASGTATQEFSVEDAGNYVLSVSAHAQQAGAENAKLLTILDHNILEISTVDAPTGVNVDFKYQIELKSGKHVLSLKFYNDFYDPKNPDPKQRDRNLAVSKVKLVKELPKISLPNGPITAMPKSETDLETPKADLSRFATTAYRRPITEVEISRLLELYKNQRKLGETYEGAIRICIQAILASPSFIFRVENKDAKRGEISLNPYELTTRLSYFIWGTTPSAELSALAKSGEILKDSVLEKQVNVMLSSDKARNLGSDFALQWLQLRRIEACSPDPKLFPDYSEELKRDMLNEVVANFMSVVYENRPITDLINTNKLYVNERLAKLYNLSGVNGDNIREVLSPGEMRGGLLSTAAFLTVTSNPNRTSPVKRGKWILEQILGTPPPLPPPNVGILPEDTAIKPTLPMKERLAIHRKNEACANCHRAMDALGFSLEHYNPIGQYRDKDGDLVVDSQGELPNGTKVDGVASLKKIILARKDDFVRSLAEKLLVYAVGRGIRAEDSCHIDKIVAEVRKSGYRMNSLILGVVKSDPFRKIAAPLEN